MGDIEKCPVCDGAPDVIYHTDIRTKEEKIEAITCCGIKVRSINTWNMLCREMPSKSHNTSTELILFGITLAVIFISVVVFNI